MCIRDRYMGIIQDSTMQTNDLETQDNIPRSSVAGNYLKYAKIMYSPKQTQFKKLSLASSQRKLQLEDKLNQNMTYTNDAQKGKKPDFVLDCCSLTAEKLPEYNGYKDKFLSPHFQRVGINYYSCLLYTSPSPRDLSTSRMPSSA
eukprot:TRINITY_DN16681_c0_g1_i1.p1 TRINITY_DN16681_c0_g1~~TRINITY_DN16681_c0_g1_i1.p1  ORF type:complete len:154 (+),score=61.78 TRINITY_DN16681_c0_g1_i1:30-464(+)